MKTLILAIGCLVLSANSVGAVDLRNEDNQTRSVLIQENSLITAFPLWARQTRTAVCTSPCRIQVNGLAIDAVGDETVVIRNGRPLIPSQLCPVQTGQTHENYWERILMR